MGNPDASIRLALWGIGRVGRSFLRLLQEPAISPTALPGLPLEIVGIADSQTALLLEDQRNLGPIIERKESTGRLEIPPGSALAVAEWREWLSQARPDVLVDTSVADFESAQPAWELYRVALGSGVAVITANKPPLVHDLKGLIRLAARRGTWLRCGATVGAALPAWAFLDLLSRQEKICRMDVVLNGTTNWMLNEMESRGIGYGEALAEAQRLGYAEPDPTRDVQGLDTAAKLLILANGFWEETFFWSDIEITGITGLTHESLQSERDRGYAVKLVGRLAGEQGHRRLSVKPECLDAAHPLAALAGSQKGIYIETTTGGRYALTGGASGPGPTAASMLRELREWIEMKKRGDAEHRPW
jgi:homoserine dehydrogenase